MSGLKPIRTEEDYDAALSEVVRLWGAKSGTPEGDRLDLLATLIDSYEQTDHRWVRQIHAAAHDVWFRAKVQQALDDPRSAMANEKVEAHFANRRAVARR